MPLDPFALNAPGIMLRLVAEVGLEQGVGPDGDGDRDGARLGGWAG